MSDPPERALSAADTPARPASGSSGRGAVVIREPEGTGIERSPADVVRLLVALALLLLVGLVELVGGQAVVDFVEELFSGLTALPDGLITTVVVATRIALPIALAAGVVAALVTRRFRLLLTAGAALVLALGLYALLETHVDATGEALVEPDDLLGPLTEDDFPTPATLASAAAVLTASAPWLARAWRRLGWTLLIGLAFTVLVTTPIAFDTITALLGGWTAGTLVLVVAGAPSRRPTGRATAEGLAEVGVDLARLEVASVDARGSTPWFGETRDGQRLFIKVLGDDERSADLLFRMYRRLIPRDLGDEKSFSTLRREVEHEALVALAAGEIGVRTPRLVTLAKAEPNGFVLVYEAIAGRSLDRVSAEDLTDDVLAGVWDQVGLLRRHRTAHRDLRLANVFLDEDGTPWLIDFGFSELVASDVLLATDLAELLASLSLQVGPDRAVASSEPTLPPADLATALERLAPYALSGATRTALKEESGLLDELRQRVEQAADAEPSGSQD